MPGYVYRRPFDYAQRRVVMRRPLIIKLVNQDPAAPTGRIMSSLAGSGGLAHRGGLAGKGGGLAG